jgi:hypothetical protein
MMSQQNQQASLHQFHHQQQQLIAAQQQQAALLSPTASAASGGVLIWPSAGPVWRTTAGVTSPTGYVSLSAAGSVLPSVPSAVSGAGAGAGGGGHENSSSANSNSSEESPPQSAGLSQAHVLTSPQVLCFGNGTFPVASFQQQLTDLCREQTNVVPQYERIEIAQKDAPNAYAYKITIPHIGVFQGAKYSTNDTEAREFAAQLALVQLAQLGFMMTPATPSIIAPTYDMLGVPMTPSPFMIPEMNAFLAMNHPLYQQQVRRAHVQQTPMESSPPIVPATTVQ